MLRAIALAALFALSTLAAAPSLAATSKPGTARKAIATKSAKPKAKSRTPARKSAASKATGNQTCRTERVRTSKGMRTRRVCSSAPAAPLRSPIAPGALDSDASVPNGPELKARSVPDRAYAVDGNIFFHQGKKYRVEGLESAPGDLARQRLQMALDRGKLRIEQLGTDEMGVTTANVYVANRKLLTGMELFE